jgi:outer membrane receptor protein involved in Fe transport
VSGISDSANLIGFYEKHGFSIRIAYNWRDKFLSGTGQTNVGGIPPTYVDEYDQIDIGASYSFGDNLQVFLDAINITDETTYVYGRATGQVLFAAQAGPRYNLGLRYNF